MIAPWNAQSFIRRIGFSIFWSFFLGRILTTMSYANADMLSKGIQCDLHAWCEAELCHNWHTVEKPLIACQWLLGADVGKPTWTEHQLGFHRILNLFRMSLKGLCHSMSEELRVVLAVLQVTAPANTQNSWPIDIPGLGWVGLGWVGLGWWDDSIWYW